ncbi:MAG: hypothetical protein IKM64_06700 [Clostridia bacterium]|nr:hypothetical protein [Clostridia bacterium]MBR2055207.1 hypothetical protein [Clostridia bacterium]MBR6809957.1 hypothetical protein [Clostridia bacterium]
MKKEKHPVYRWVMGFFIVLLLLGIAMLVISIAAGDQWILPGPARTL